MIEELRVLLIFLFFLFLTFPLTWSSSIENGSLMGCFFLFCFFDRLFSEVSVFNFDAKPLFFLGFCCSVFTAVVSSILFFFWASSAANCFFSSSIFSCSFFACSTNSSFFRYVLFFLTSTFTVLVLPKPPDNFSSLCDLLLIVNFLGADVAVDFVLWLPLRWCMRTEQN